MKRFLLSSVFAGSLALGACTTTQVTETETYASEALAGLTAVLANPTIKADLGTNLGKAQAALANAQTANAVLNGTAGIFVTTTPQSAAQEISTATSTIIGLVDGIPNLPASVSTVVTAIGVVVPVMLASVQLSAPVGAAQGSMSLQDAQSILAQPKV